MNETSIATGHGIGLCTAAIRITPESRYIKESPLATAEKRVVLARDVAEAAAAGLKDAEAALAAEKVHQALMVRCEYELELARVTCELLQAIRIGGHTSPSATLAKFRKELLPLAKTYGFTIVRVGDNTRACLSKI